MNTRIVRLGSVCTVISGSTPKSDVAEYWDGDVKWITPAELTEDSYIITDSVRHITSQAVQDTSLKPFPEGTVILSSRAPIGKTAIAGCEMYCNQGFKNLICSPQIDPKYLYCFLSGKTEFLNSLGRGATFKEISKSIVENIEIPLPELSVQKRISLQFEHIRTLIRQYREQLHFLDQLVKSRFIDMFGTPEINEKGFPLYTIDDVIEFQGGSQPDKKYFEYESTPDNIRLIQIRDYKSDRFITYIPKSMARRFCTADDIMIGRYGPPIFQILKGIEGSFNVALMKATPKMGNKEFIRHFLMQECLLHYLEGLSKRTAGQDGIQMDKLKAYPFPYPPLDLQNEFATFALQIDKSKVEIQNALNELEILKKSLMQQYFG